MDMTSHHDAGRDAEPEHSEDRGRDDAPRPDVDAFARSGRPEDLEAVLDTLDELPAEDHGPVYERLLAELRRQLDHEPSTVPQGLRPRANTSTGDTSVGDTSTGGAADTETSGTQANFREQAENPDSAGGEDAGR